MKVGGNVANLYTVVLIPRFRLSATDRWVQLETVTVPPLNYISMVLNNETDIS
jgi:hypothetical protein